ncbi:MAG: hypothetical protein U1B84_21390, partial [Variovorax sp.]|nr:hypothetical protein [Variovorax sp.]
MSASLAPASAITTVDYRTDPSQYRHWKLSFDGAVATLAIDINEDAGIRPRRQHHERFPRPRVRHHHRR